MVSSQQLESKKSGHLAIDPSCFGHFRMMARPPGRSDADVQGARLRSVGEHPWIVRQWGRPLEAGRASISSSTLLYRRLWQPPERRFVKRILWITVVRLVGRETTRRSPPRQCETGTRQVGLPAAHPPWRHVGFAPQDGAKDSADDQFPMETRGGDSQSLARASIAKKPAKPNRAAQKSVRLSTIQIDGRPLLWPSRESTRFADREENGPQLGIAFR